MRCHRTSCSSTRFRQGPRASSSEPSSTRRPKPDATGSEQLILAKHATIGPAADRRRAIAPRFQGRRGSFLSFRRPRLVPERPVRFVCVRADRATARGCRRRTSVPDKVVTNMTPRELWRSSARPDRRCGESPARLSLALRRGRGPPATRPPLREPGLRPSRPSARRVSRFERQGSRVRTEPRDRPLPIGWCSPSDSSRHGRDAFPSPSASGAPTSLVLTWVIVRLCLMRSPPGLLAGPLCYSEDRDALTASVARLSRCRKTARDTGAVAARVSRPRGFRFSSVLDRYIGRSTLRMLSLRSRRDLPDLLSRRAEGIDRRRRRAQAASNSRTPVLQVLHSRRADPHASVRGHDRRSPRRHASVAPRRAHRVQGVRD